MKKRTINHVIVVLYMAGAVLARAQSAITVTVNGKQIQVPHSKPGTTVGRVTITTNDVLRFIANTVRAEILAQCVEASGITVPDEVLTHCVDLYFSAAGVGDEQAQYIRDKMRPIIEALNDVVAGKLDREQAYERHLKDKISREEWAVWVTGRTNKSRVEELERLVPRSVEDMKQQTRVSLRKDIEIWLLLEQVAGEPEPARPEIEALYRKLYPTGEPPLAEVERSIAARIVNERKQRRVAQWWETQIAKATIELPTQYQAAQELIEAPPAQPFLPSPIVDYLRKTVLTNQPSKQLGQSN